MTERFDAADHYRLEVDHFAKCVEHGKTPRIDREESVTHAETLAAIIESAQSGECVVVNE